MVYDHSRDHLAIACGISNERFKEMSREFARQTIIDKDKIVKHEMATSVLLEIIENMPAWTTTEKLYMAYKYGDFTGDITGLASLSDMLSRLDPSMVGNIVGIGRIPLSKKKSGGFTPDDFANAKKKSEPEEPDFPDISFVKEP